MVNVDQIAKLIQELGYRAQVDGGAIRTAMSGWSILVFPFEDDSIQMYLGIPIGRGRNFGLDQANDFNKDFRHVKCYLADGVARFEQDFYFDVTKATAKDDLERIFLSWESSIGSAQKALDATRI